MATPYTAEEAGHKSGKYKLAFYLNSLIEGMCLDHRGGRGDVH